MLNKNDMINITMDKMPYILIPLAIILIIIIVVLFKKKQDIKTRSHAEEIASKHASKIKEFFDYFENAKNKGEYITNTKENEIKWEYTEIYDELKRVPIKYLMDSSDVNYSEFLKCYTSLRNYRESINKEIIESEKFKYDSFFSNIDGKSLDEQQREAVIADEDYNLVIAGAGSGKTLTISAKVKYLCEIKGIRPEDILLISKALSSSSKVKNSLFSFGDQPIKAR